MPRRLLYVLFSSVSIILPALGEGTVPQMSCARSLRATSQIPVAVLDFDGDGFSDIVGSRTLGAVTEFSILRSSDSVEVFDSIAKGEPAPGDYDGDGKWDIATVDQSGNSVAWTIKLSTTGQVVTHRLGTASSKAVLGCRLGDTGATSLAAVSDRRVIFRQISSEETQKISFANFKDSELLGCGDITNDGKDDLIVRGPARKSKLEAIATVGCSNEIIVYRNAREFESGGIINQNGIDFPIVIALRRFNSRSRYVNLEPIAEILEYPRYAIANGGDFSSGYFKTASGGSYGVLRQAEGSSQVSLRYIDGSTNDETQVATLKDGRRLVSPQKVVRKSS